MLAEDETIESVLARIQQLITIGLLTLAAAWIIAFSLRGAYALAISGALLITFGYAVILAVEFGLMWFVNGGDSAPRASVAQLVKAWWGEVVTAPGVFCWRQPFRSRVIPDTPTAACVGRRGIVFVHGFVCNRGFWNPWMRSLNAARIPFVAVNLEPVFGAIDHYAEIIEKAVSALSQRPDSRPSSLRTAWAGSRCAHGCIIKAPIIGCIG